MKSSFIAVMIVFFFSFIHSAHSALLIEPVLGYNLGTTLDFENGDKYSGGSGLGLGGRLGYQNLGFQLGLDYLRSTIDLNDKDFAEDVELSEWAGFVGFKFPILLRVYAGYIFSATGETKDAGGKLEFSKGSGTKIGVGFTGLPFLNINLEYRAGTLGEYKYAGFKIKEDTGYKSILLAFSVPFAI